ncbi:restriction endonuclease [candidate division WOR-3 bacterium JGI_Cruoil_03_51_56]|uniref:Restriction endonuclease n=1 Tax=candidate division WOR-3 bacterium JGI_Cruoil_03_51_56 TaxID=1973747 RepID=A0A235BSM7_UNCW3|nr:MAG: restriction endonuclease [candidate division WOR-3 bacterium JGI_Cruoil_03_51_56]
MKPKLTLTFLKQAARDFVKKLSRSGLKELYGVTDGKAIGTYVEHKFHDYLTRNYTYGIGSSASGIDFPKLNVDLKVTSIRQPQSSCPFKSASQKVYGLGYHLLVFVYEKMDRHARRVTYLRFHQAIFVQKEHTGDYQATKGILDILNKDGNKDDIETFLLERNLPLDDIGRERLARKILQRPPKLGYLTVSNALQWRLQYGRIVSIVQQGGKEGVENLLTRAG